MLAVEAGAEAEAATEAAAEAKAATLATRGAAEAKAAENGAAAERWRAKAVAHVSGALAKPLASRIDEVALLGMEVIRGGGSIARGGGASGSATEELKLAVGRHAYAAGVAALPGPDLVATFKLHNLVAFYADTVSRKAFSAEDGAASRGGATVGGMGAEPSVVGALRSVGATIACRFRAILRARGDELLSQRSSVLKVNLGVSSGVVEAVSELTEILDVFASSMSAR